jgi:hypothetical protein
VSIHASFPPAPAYRSSPRPASFHSNLLPFPDPCAARVASTPGKRDHFLHVLDRLRSCTMSYPTLPPVTPQKPLPGAFFQTPATSNAPISQSIASSQTATQPTNSSPQTVLPRFPPASALKPATAPTSTTEDRAARTVNDTLAQEARYPDLDSYLSRKWTNRINLN